MSYILFLRGFECELGTLSIAQTKQVNDIANITNRNSNFTQAIKLPKTAKNVLIMQNLGAVGNQTNIPYQKIDATLIDTDTGEPLITNGWAVVTETTNTYNVTVYDGYIDFFREIENLTITQCGISDLNHIKSLSNIIGTWTDETKPYRYILADYNGNNLYLDKINIDYQVPSASCFYIWNRIFDFIGYEYEGSIFNHEDFRNLWLTFPKPTGELEPNRIEINEQTSDNENYVINYVSGGGVTGSYTTINADVWRENFTELEAQNITTGQVTTTTTPPVSTIPVQSYVEILEEGTYSIDFEGADGLFFFIGVRNALNEIVLTATFQEGYIFNASVGDRVFCSVTPDPALGVNTQWVVAGGGVPIGLDFIGVAPPDMSLITTTFSRIDGYAVNFDEIFIDFKVTDFLKEILVRFGLTPFKDKHTKKVKFLTLFELLQNPNINDYSDKFINVVSEKYNFGSYAKRNTFKYKYNDEGFKHNDGFIEIANENLKDETTLIQSQIYSPESVQSNFLTKSHVYKIWEKEIKDDGTVEYKDLENRFYFQRAEKKTLGISLISELTSDEATASFYFRESYFRLNYQAIINDWYSPIKAIFNKAKFITANFYLKAFEVANFDFSRLIYVEQRSSYYIVNKVVNFVKGKPTKLELIKVDYFTQPDNSIPDIEPAYLTIESAVETDCNLVLTIDTNLPQPFSAGVIVYTYDFFVGAFQETPQVPQIFVTVDSDTASIPLDTFPFNVFGYKFALRTGADFTTPLITNLTETQFLDGSCFTGEEIIGTEITVTNAVALSVNGFQRLLRVYYESDFVGSWNFTVFVGNFGAIYQLNATATTPNGFIDIEIQHPTAGGTSNCSITAQNGVQSNVYQYIT